MLAIQVATTSMFDARQFQLSVAQHATGRTFGNRIEAFVVKIACSDVVVSSYPVAIVQRIMEDRVVVSQDSVIGVGVSKELG